MPEGNQIPYDTFPPGLPIAHPIQKQLNCVLGETTALPDAGRLRRRWEPMPPRGYFLLQKALFPVTHALDLNTARKSPPLADAEKLPELLCSRGQLGKVQCEAQRDSLLCAKWGDFWLPEMLYPCSRKLERRGSRRGCRQPVQPGVDLSVLPLASGNWDALRVIRRRWENTGLYPVSARPLSS